MQLYLLIELHQIIRDVVKHLFNDLNCFWYFIIVSVFILVLATPISWYSLLMTDFWRTVHCAIDMSFVQQSSAVQYIII